jgi:hypothetical protein
VNALLDAISRDPWRSATKALALAIVYEDSHTHRVANAAYEALLRVFGEDAVLTATWWRTSLIADSKLAQVAALSIAASDVILVAARSDSSPSPSIRAWIESWPVDSSRPKLLALLGGGHEELGEWNTVLGELAMRRQLIYVPCPPPLHNGEGFEASGESRPGDRFIQPYQHWGLNE